MLQRPAKFIIETREPEQDALDTQEFGLILISHHRSTSKIEILRDCDIICEQKNKDADNTQEKCWRSS